METIYEQLGITPRGIIGSIVQFELDFATVGCYTQESINDFCNKHNCEILSLKTYNIPGYTKSLLQIGNFE